MKYNQQKHPELRPGEMWLTNGNFFEEYPYKTKRRGKVAYSRSGEEIPSMCPWFISVDEFNNRDRVFKTIEDMLNGK